MNSNQITVYDKYTCILKNNYSCMAPNIIITLLSLL